MRTGKENSPRMHLKVRIPSKGELVRQINGPCKGMLFVVEETDGDLLHVRLLDPPKGYNKDAEWSHQTNYMVVNEK